jgi:hypothetical protein
MLFMMLICRDSVPVATSGVPAGQEVERWVSTMDGRGVRLAGGELAPDAQARVVRVRDGQVETAEGAFLSTDGALLGFDVLECRDMDEAVEVASVHPLAKRHVLELRPVYA